MKHSGNLTVTTPSDREIAMSRVFNAPCRLVFDAYTKCEYLKKWLGVFDGWTLDLCEIDLKVGGSYRYVWKNVNGTEMGMGGVYREIVAGERVVATEKFDESWYEGEAVDTTTFSETGGKTTLTITVRYASKVARDGVLKSGMAEGVTAGFDTLDEVLATQTGGATT
ncbi:MAG: SRPBCC family protein [Gemmatimonadota bacterium]|nr:SRPBCC family protein [Gemmatimonadota bacterium]